MEQPDRSRDVCRIWFVPTNTSHVGKLKPFMDALRGRGHDVRLLCLDPVHLPVHHTRPQIARTGYPFEVMSPGRYRQGRHWLISAARRPRLVEAIRAFLAGGRADAFVFGADTGLVSRTFVQTAHAAGIPTVLVPDGLVLPRNPNYRLPPAARISAAIANAVGRLVQAGGARGASGVDLILVMSETGRRALAAAGLSPDKIHVVGSCEYDALASQAPAGIDETALARRVGLPPGRPVVLFVHQDNIDAEATRRVVRTLVAGARRGGGVALLKFHPRLEQDLEKWRTWARCEKMAPDEAAFIRGECTSVEAVRLCSVCVTAYSTVALEALLYRKPLVLVQYLNLPMRLEYGREYGAAIEAEKPEDLEEAIASLLTDGALRDRLSRGAKGALEKEVGGLDGKSAERMVESLIGLVQRARAAKGK